MKSTGKKNGGCKEPSIEQNEEENGNDSNIINTAWGKQGVSINDDIRVFKYFTKTCSILVWWLSWPSYKESLLLSSIKIQCKGMVGMWQGVSHKKWMFCKPVLCPSECSGKIYF